jgi:O-antigen ligase
VLGAVFISVLTIIQVAVDDPNLQFGGFAKIDQGHIYGEVKELRPAGPVGDANYLARILILAVPLAAFLGLKRDGHEQWSWIAAAALIGLAILFTYSRGGMLTLGAIVALMVPLGRVRITPGKVALAFVLFLALLPTNVGRRMLTIVSLLEESDVSVVDASAAKRRQLLTVGLHSFLDHPLLGVGFGNFGANFSPYANQIGLASVDYIPAGLRQFAHNLYLEVAVETGLLGLMAFLGSMAVAFVTMFRARRKLLARGQIEEAAIVTAIALGLAGYLISSVLLHSGWHRYLWMFLGFAVAVVRLTDEEAVS